MLARTLCSAEALEKRWLLQGSWVNNGQIMVEGTSGNDLVTVSWQPNTDTVPGGFKVTVNGQSKVYPRASWVKGFTVKLLGGDDRFEVQSADEVYRPFSIYGGSGNDTILGSWHCDKIWGEAGNDSIMGAVRGDSLYGGDGNDTIQGGQGGLGLTTPGNFISGGYGQDSITGGDSADEIHGGDARDTIRGLWGNDTLYGEDGNDLMMGNYGNDELYGNNGDDDLYGGPGDDYLTGNAGHNLVDGEENNDHLVSFAGGTDTLIGGSGDDRIDAQSGQDSVTN